MNVWSRWTPQIHFNKSMLQTHWNTGVTNPCAPEPEHISEECSVCDSRTQKTVGNAEFKLQLQSAHVFSKPVIFSSVKPRNGMWYFFLLLNYWNRQRKYFLGFMSLSSSPLAPALCSLVLICAEDTLQIYNKPSPVVYTGRLSLACLSRN